MNLFGAEKRRAAYISGLRAETMATLLLRLKFYKILARRYRIREGEIDIIARRGDVIAFVEVKARAVMDDAMTAITPEKQRRFSRAAARWISEHPWAANHVLRADAIFLAPGKWPKHVIAAMEMQIG